MNKATLGTILSALFMCIFCLNISAQKLIFKNDFSTPESIKDWTIVDANNDGITWKYDTSDKPGNVACGYHSQNAADDWFFSPTFTAEKSSTLLVKYSFYGSFYSEQLELYITPHATVSDSCKLINKHVDLKDKVYEGAGFVEMEKGEKCHIAFRAASLPNKLRLGLISVEVYDVTPIAKDGFPYVSEAENSLSLAATHKYVGINTPTEVKLALLHGEKDVTKDATFYMTAPDGTTTNLEKASFAPQEIGDYQCYATYGELSTIEHPITIHVRQHIPTLPDDPQPEGTDFSQQVLLTQGTGLRCQYCPNGIAAIHNFYKGHPLAPKVVHMAIHAFGTTDPLSSPAAFLLHEKLNLGGFPNMIINYHPEWKDSGLASTQFEELITTAVDKALSQGCGTGLSLSSHYDNTTGKISVSVGAKVNTPGLYRLSVAVVQDSVYLPQSGTSNVDYYMHNSSLRMLSPTNAEGEWLNAQKAELIGKIYPYHCEFSASNLLQSTSYGYRLDIEKHARIIAYTQRLDGTIDNVAVCRINASQPFAYDSVAPEPPTVGIHDNVLSTPSSTQVFSIYDTSGKCIGCGSDTESLTRNLTPGVYIVRGVDTEGEFHKKIIVR